MDVWVRVPSIPEWGRAVQAEKLELLAGGKGFNQAIAASRLGASVCIIGAVGQDEFSEKILNELTSANVDVVGVDIVRGATAPVTIVLSRAGGDTSFVGWKNANNIHVDAELVSNKTHLIRNADVLLSTLEVSPEAVSAALRAADQPGCMSVLNPAPPLERPQHKPSDLPLHLVDVLIPNEWEARELAGKRGLANNSVRDVAMFLNTLGARAVCITRAQQGCSFLRRGIYREYEAFETEADDTTGASDAFCAALGLHMSAGYETEEAIHQAQAAGSWTITKHGAGRHMPTKEELDLHRDYLEGLRNH